MQTKIYQIGQILPVLPSSKLLGDARHQNLMLELLPLSRLSEPHFKALYRGAINQYAEFVQLVPEEQHNALGGLLNLGLARAVLSLRQTDWDASSKAEINPLILYAIFTASLFYDVVKVISQQRVVICNQLGNYSQEWYPYSGSMVDAGFGCYKMYPYNTNVYQSLNHESAALIARQLLPKEGFLWLSSDLELLIDWLESVRGEQGKEGRRVGRALALIRNEDLINLIESLQHIQIELIGPKELPLLDQFYEWLRESIANGTVQINTKEATVHYLDDGSLYLNNEIFKQYTEANKQSEDAQKLAREFNEQFGLSNHVINESRGGNTFLSQSWEPKTTQGTLAFAAQFIMDFTGIPVSPLQEKIKSGMKSEIKGGSLNSYQLSQTGVVKQSMKVEQRPDSSFSFKMR